MTTIIKTMSIVLIIVSKAIQTFAFRMGSGLGLGW